MAFPREEELRRYTARRLSCGPKGIPRGRTTVVRVEEVEAQFFESGAFYARDVVNLCALPEATIVQINRGATPAVLAACDRLETDRKTSAESFASRCSDLIGRRGTPEPYLYLAAGSFRPAPTTNARELTAADAAALWRLRSLLPPREAEYVGSEHPVVFGAFDDDVLVAAAGLFLFDTDSIAVAGVIAHPDHRRRGFGKAAACAACQWALDRGMIVEWSTTVRNKGSLGIATTLGFKRYCLETEFVMRED